MDICGNGFVPVKARHGEDIARCGEAQGFRSSCGRVKGSDVTEVTEFSRDNSGRCGGRAAMWREIASSRVLSM